MCTNTISYFICRINIIICQIPIQGQKCILTFFFILFPFFLFSLCDFAYSKRFSAMRSRRQHKTMKCCSEPSTSTSTKPNTKNSSLSSAKPINNPKPPFVPAMDDTKPVLQDPVIAPRPPSLSLSLCLSHFMSLLNILVSFLPCLHIMHCTTWILKRVLFNLPFCFFFYVRY